MKGDELDPKALIREAYAIEGIDIKQCRTIFMDWALSIPANIDTSERLKSVLQQYQSKHPDHPMTLVMKEGLAPARPARRRGGASGRIRFD